MLIGEEHSYPAAAGERALTRKKKNKMKRRFSDEQIRSLETIFESESKLEPRQKLELASELGLQPRQVAIWFQNKRARWKSKQLEQEYSILQANYTSLAARFEALKKEKQAVTIQLHKLNELLQKPQEETRFCSRGLERRSCNDGESSDNGGVTNTKYESEAKPSLGMENGGVAGVLSDEDSSIKAEYFGVDEEPDLMKMVEPGDGSLTSSDNWGSFNTDGLFDESSSSSQWWDFWS